MYNENIDLHLYNLGTVLDTTFSGKEVSNTRDVLWPIVGAELLGICHTHNDSTKRSRRHAVSCNIYDAMRKMDAADVKMPTYIGVPVGIGRLSKYSLEDLNVVAMDQRIRAMENHCIPEKVL